MQFEKENLRILKQVEVFLSERRIESYLVGGFVRDLLIGRETADIDLAIQADALKTAQEMAAALQGKYVPLDEGHGIARVVLFPVATANSKKQWYIDLSTMVDGIENDLARRDFTVNAMAVPLKAFLESAASLNIYLPLTFDSSPTGGEENGKKIEGVSPLQVIDPFQGQDDLDNRQIRAVSQSIFKEDPLRLLRAIRLAAELDLTILPETAFLIRQSAPLISQVAGERIHEELVRILGAVQAGRFVRYMDDLGLLTALIPELESGRSVEQPEEHHWKVLDHAIESVAAAGFMIRQGQWLYGDSERLRDIPWSDELDRYFRSEVANGSTQAALLKLAALLHDIAKPETKILVGEKIRFYGHDQQGADAVKYLLERLRFSNKEIELVERMVRFHMRPTQIGHEEVPTRRAVFRYFRDTGSAGIDVLFLSLADHLAARGPNLDPEQWRWHVAQVAFLLNEYFNKKETVSPPKLIDGHDLMRAFGLAPGPEIREILDSVKEAQAAGEIGTRGEALSYVKNRLLYRKQNLKG